MTHRHKLSRLLTENEMYLGGGLKRKIVLTIVGFFAGIIIGGALLGIEFEIEVLKSDYMLVLGLF